MHLLYVVRYERDVEEKKKENKGVKQYFAFGGMAEAISTKG